MQEAADEPLTVQQIRQILVFFSSFLLTSSVLVVHLLFSDFLFFQIETSYHSKENIWHRNGAGQKYHPYVCFLFFSFQMEDVIVEFRFFSLD